MATILSLALKVNADASGVVKNLTPAERALENLAKQAAKATSVFDEFAKNSEAASAAQVTLNDKFAALAEQLKGGLNAQAYADQYAALQDEVRNTADAFAEAAKVIDENRTAEEKRADTLSRLSELRAIGALSEEQYARAVAKSSGANSEAAKAEEDRLRLLERGRQITEQFLTDEERRARQLEELNQIIAANGIAEEAAARARFEFSGLADQLERDGLELRRQLTAEREADAAKEKAALEQIAAVEKRLAEDSAAAQRLRSQETAKAAAIIAAGRTAQQIFNDALDEAIDLERKGLLTKKQLDVEIERQNALLNKAKASADGFGKSVKNAAESGLKFNELSGILAALPGPLGNIAGRFSGISSAAEGLGRVFNGGLNAGISSLSAQLSSLLTPANIAVAAFGAAAAGSAALVRGLVDLEGRVEQLGNAALRLGTDFLTIQVLNEAASRSGVAIDALAAGIQKLAVNIDKARTGTGDAAKAFDELGISQQELNTLDPAALAERTAQALQGIEDPARRAALATDTLGKAGLSLLPGFNAIAESEQSLRRFSAAISEVDRDRIGSLGQAFDNVKTSLAGLGQAALLPFAGAVDGVARLIADIIGSVNRLAQAIGFVLQPALDAIGKGFSLLGDGIAAVNGLFDYLTGSNQKATQEVRTLRAEMEEPLEAGFVKEFARDLEQINASLNDAINESVAFGQAGFDAALRYQEAIRKLQQQLDDGIINEEVFRRSAEQAGNAFKQELAKIEQDAKLEIQVTENAAQAVAGIRAELSKAIDESAALGQAGFDAALQYQNAVEELQRQFEAGIINEETLSRGAEAAQAAYEGQVESVKKLEQEQRKLIENDIERINTLLAANDAATKLEQDLQTVQREQARVSEELAAARASDNQAQADAAAARQGELDQLQAKLEEQQQALEQGFGQGFQAAFDNINQNIDGLIAKAQQFGQAGFDAALRLQEGIAAAQQQAKDGILNAEAFNQEVQRQQELFNAELQHLEDVKKQKEKDAADAAALQKQQNADLLTAQEQYQKEQQTALNAYQQQQQQAQQAYAQEQARIFEEQRKAAEAEAKRQEERLRKLNTLGPQSVSVSDVRTTEGANLVMALAANAQDPALIQARLQTKFLEKISGGIAQAAANYFNTPVAIVGSAQLGG